MKTIACWASQHQWTARFLIVVFHLLLSITGFLLGSILLWEDVVFSTGITYLVSIITLSIVSFYPIATHGRAYKESFVLRKRLDLILISCTFYFFMLTGNSSNNLPVTSLATIPAYAAKPVAASLTTTPPLPHKLSKTVKKKYLKNLQQQLKTKYKRIGTGGKILLIVAAVLVAIALAYGVAALACTIMCSGPEALGWAVLVVGLGAIIFLLVRVIRQIIRIPRTRRENTTTESRTLP